MTHTQEPAHSHRMLTGMIAAVFFILGGAVYFLVYKNFPPYLVNDSAVEILQIRSFEPWPLQAFIPSYRLGLVVMIESFYGYWMQPFLWLLGDSIPVFKLALGIVFALTGALFFVLSKRIFSLPVALLITFTYITSAYTVWWPLLLLRNAFCPLMMIGMLLGLMDLQEGRSQRGLFILTVSSFIAINTYSTFKVVVPAVFMSALLAGFFAQQPKSYLKNVSLSGLILAVLIAIFFLYAHVDSELLFRGSYMLADNDLDLNRDFNTYFIFFMRCFFLPVYENAKGFLADPTHFTFDRSMLNSWLYAVWFLGLAVIVVKAIKKDATAFICLATLIFSFLGLCIGGPSLKTHFALAPLEFIVIAYGFNVLLQKPALRKFMLVLLSVFVVYVGYLEQQYMITHVKSTNNKALDAVGQEVGLYLAEHSKEFDFVIYGTYSVDLMRVFFPAYPFKSEAAAVFDKNEFVSVLKQKASQYNRLWLVMTPRSPYYAQIQNEGSFCFEKNINERTDAALLVRCDKK